MATYAIGDVHGCKQTLKSLLAKIGFTAGEDRLWFVGDLVNGGPDSVGVLRFVRELSDHATVVLGNHDLHMLAVDVDARKYRDKDTFQRVFEVPDGPVLLEWLRHQPLMYREGPHVLVHAGIYPDWSVELAASLAGEVEAQLRSDDYADFFDEMYGNRPNVWREDLSGVARLRFAVNAFTRMRCVAEGGGLDFDYSGTYEDIPDDLSPWFEAPNRPTRKQTLYFGHWSALGHRVFDESSVVALDSGCVWGNRLTAYRLQDGKVFQVESELESRLA